MSAPPKSFLDPGQVLQHAFDDTTGKLRVDAEITANLAGVQEVLIDEADDSILTYGNDGATNRAIKTDADGHTQVDVLTMPAVTVTGGATSAKQDTAQTSLSAIAASLDDLVDGSISDVAQDSTLQDIGDRLTKTTTSSVSSVAANASTVTLLSAESDRLSFSCYNDSSSSLYLKYGATASTTSFTVKIPANGFYEAPSPVYVGVIDGIWDTAIGSARLTELT